MLSPILRSPTAIAVSIEIIRALYVQNNAICLFYNECPRPQGGA